MCGSVPILSVHVNACDKLQEFNKTFHDFWIVKVCFDESYLILITQVFFNSQKRTEEKNPRKTDSRTTTGKASECVHNQL